MNYNSTSISTPSDASSEPTEPAAKKATKQPAKTVQRATQAKIDRVYSKLTKVEDEVSTPSQRTPPKRSARVDALNAQRTRSISR